MGLSPSTLFHFTSKDGLKGILSDNFKLKYCFEAIPDTEKPINLAIPMVSFCDIKISEIIDHTKKYGRYGIGLSKAWAYEKGLNPVIYQNLNSPFAKNMISNIRKLNRQGKLSIDEKESLVDILRYIKVYEGRLDRNGEVNENYRFSDEREWRYVPEFNPSNNFENFLTLKEYNTKEKKELENKKLQNERLEFNANQILYLIVEKESEINEVISHIRNVKGHNYTYDEIDRLNTRILSYERILNDF